MSIFLPLINILGFWTNVLAAILLIPMVLDGLAFSLVAYSFKIFQLMCAVNFNSLYGIIQPLVDRLQAVIIVFVVYLLGVSFIKYMLDPDKAAEGGKKFLRNLFIATALFVSYNFIFSVFNELNIALMGNSFGYKYTTLSEVFDVDESTGDGKEDNGLIIRFIFGDSDIDDHLGLSIASNLGGIFYRDGEQSESHYELDKQIGLGTDNASFFKIINYDFAKRIAEKELRYIPLLGFVVALFVTYSMFSASLQVGIRMFKLLILQMLAPIIIVDVIQHGFDGKFKTYMKKYISVFLEAFIRMLTILIITVFVSKFLSHIGDYFPTLSSKENLVTKFIIMIIIVIAAYMFAGQVPKFIDEIIGTHIADNSGKGGFGHFVGGMIGAGVGLAAGIGTGTAAGAISGLVGGATAGAKGKNIADFFKGQADNATKTRNIGANARMAGGSLEYAKARVGGAFGRPQRLIEQGQLAADQQSAMDNMIKNLEDYYDENILINGQEVGLDRELFKNYAYDNTNPYGFYQSLSEDTREAVDRTNSARDAYTSANSVYDELRSSGVYDQTLNGGQGGWRAANSTELETAYKNVEDARTTWQSLKAKTDKKVDTDYNARMIEGATTDPQNRIKAKGRNTVQRSIETYDHIADEGHTTSEMTTRVATQNGGFNYQSSTKKAGDHYTQRQDETTHSRSAERYRNTNARGGGK